MVVITDGENNVEAGQSGPQAQQAQAAGITMYVIGITSAADQNELRSMSSPPQQRNVNWWMLTSFNDLYSVVDSIAQAVCTSRMF